MKLVDAIAKADELSKSPVYKAYGDNIVCTVREEYYKKIKGTFTSAPIPGYYTEPLDRGYDYYGDTRNLSPKDLLADDYVILYYLMDRNNFNRISYSELGDK